MEKNFDVKVSIVNGKYISKKNMARIVAISTRPCTRVHGVPAIDKSIKENGTYFEKWVIKKEKEGYIFREINHGGGISGHWSTLRMLIFHSCYSGIIVKLEEKEE